MFPALSVHVPESEAAALSGPPYVVDVHAAIPDVRSLPLNAIGTAWLYQPLTSAPRAAAPPVTTGAVLSTLILHARHRVGEVLGVVGAQTSFVPVVSAVRVLSVQPASTVASDGITVQSIVTFSRYQPEQSSGAGVHLTVTVTVASARAAPNNITKDTTATIAAMALRRPVGTSRNRGTSVPGPSRYCGWGRIKKRGGCADLGPPEPILPTLAGQSPGIGEVRSG